MSNTTKVANSFFDEALEVSDSEDQTDDKKYYGAAFGNPERPPDDEEEEEIESDHPSLHDAIKSYVPRDSPESGKHSREVSDRGPGKDSKEARSSTMNHPSTSRGASKIHDVDRVSVSHGLNADIFASLDDEVKKVLDFIVQYSPPEHEMETRLCPFVPEMIPSIGDIDPFIKIPTQDGKENNLGLAMVDEPATQLSDPAVLDLQLRAFSKSSSNGPSIVRSLDATLMAKDKRPLEAWIKNMKDLHGQKPAPKVNYTKRMPDLEDLMQTWPSDFEDSLNSVPLPSPELDLPLDVYCQMLALLLDIPCRPEKKVKHAAHTIEAMHVVLSLYLEFQQSAHFQAVHRS